MLLLACCGFYLSLLRLESTNISYLVGTRVSNGTEQCNFSRQRDRSSFIVLGQRDKLKILPRDGTGRDSQNSGRDRPGQQKSQTGRGKKQDRAEKDVLKLENDVLKQKTVF